MAPLKVAPLNCLCVFIGSPEEAYALAVAVYSTKDVDPSVLKVATQLFAYAGNLGDHNAQYTYAQLLRMGK